MYILSFTDFIKLVFNSLTSRHHGTLDRGRHLSWTEPRETSEYKISANDF